MIHFTSSTSLIHNASFPIFSKLMVCLAVTLGIPFPGAILSNSPPAFAQGMDAEASSQDTVGLVQDKVVGPVRVHLELSPQEPLIGDEVTLKIQATAEEGVELLMPEFGEALSRYSILEFVPKSQRVGGEQVETQIYTLQPIRSGPQSIPQILVEFVDNRPGKQAAPEDFDAFEILTERIDFNVRSVLQDGDQTLAPPMPKLEIVEPSKAGKNWVWWAAGGLGLAVVALSVLLWSRRGTLKPKSAYEIASIQLSELRHDRSLAQPTLSTDEFFVEISAVVRNYVEATFGIKAPELTTDEFLTRAAESHRLSGQHQSLLREFLEQADVVKFAGVSAGDREIGRSLELATQFLQETRPGSLDSEPGDQHFDRPDSLPSGGSDD